MSSHVPERIRQFILTSYLFGDHHRMPSDTESLMASGVLDSTGVLELIEFLESEFGISVAESETVPANLDSIDGLVCYVSAKEQAGDEGVA
ncbi:acyl carrier protein [Ornithinimicrobium sp. CNJ-824]|uniref:acyl carrier protein n=1 Tax=Ornithinimicrobium sp. CNJ-824 TaxID=1904966 RepID=UPI00095F1360|nr:acyl carrier protein [Ornithinimicrobium sp. CNJ-824]OLT21963.1 acyl carrier protein [Ornithinimicrobium sp. CNJ-824]